MLLFGMSMDCSQADIWLVDYLYGELPEQERQAFELHLQSCPAHTKEVERLRAVLSLMRKDSREDPSDRVSKELLQAAKESITRTSQRRGWLNWIRTPLAAAAALLVVIGIGAAVYFNEGFEKRSVESASKVIVAEQKSPSSSVESGAAKPSVVDRLSTAPKDDSEIIPDKAEPILNKTPAPQKTAERAKGLGEKTIRFSGEPISEKPKARDEELSKKVGVEKMPDRAFTPPPEDYHEQYAGSAGIAATEKSTVESLKRETALPATAAAPPRALQRKILTEDKKAPQSAPTEAVADKPMGAVSNEELPPLGDSDVEQNIRKHVDEIIACVQKFSSIRGKFVINITVVNTGVVNDVSIFTEHFKGAIYAGCVGSKIKKDQFPKFEGQQKTISVPFVVK